MAIRNIIFGWSGTLSDDFTPVYQASMLVFKQLGGEPISTEEYKREFTLPYTVFLNKYFPELTKEEQDELFLQAIHQVEEPKLYDGVKDCLERLKSIALNLIVISSHLHDQLMTEATNQGVQSLFQEINGSIYDKTETISGIL